MQITSQKPTVCFLPFPFFFNPYGTLKEKILTHLTARNPSDLLHPHPPPRWNNPFPTGPRAEKDYWELAYLLLDIYFEGRQTAGIFAFFEISIFDSVFSGIILTRSTPQPNSACPLMPATTNRIADYVHPHTQIHTHKDKFYGGMLVWFSIWVINLSIERKVLSVWLQISNKCRSQRSKWPRVWLS